MQHVITITVAISTKFGLGYFKGGRESVIVNQDFHCELLVMLGLNVRILAVIIMLQML